MALSGQQSAPSAGVGSQILARCDGIAQVQGIQLDIAHKSLDILKLVLAAATEEPEGSPLLEKIEELTEEMRSFRGVMQQVADALNRISPATKENTTSVFKRPPNGGSHNGD